MSLENKAHEVILTGGAGREGAEDVESRRLTRDRRATQGVQRSGPETRPTLKPWQAQPPRSTPSDARPDSDFDLLVVMPQATLTPQERQQATRSLRAAAGIWWRGPCGRRGSLMSPAEDALLVLHGQEPLRSHSLQRLLQELALCGDSQVLAPELLDLDDFAVLARYEAEPTPLPADRRRLLELLQSLVAEVRQPQG